MEEVREEYEDSEYQVDDSFEEDSSSADSALTTFINKLRFIPLLDKVSEQAFTRVYKEHIDLINWINKTFKTNFTYFSSEPLPYHILLETSKRQNLDICYIQALAIRAKNARKSILISNLRLVVNNAKKYNNISVPSIDLIQEGNLGLDRALQKFEPEKGFKFSTYATWWIKQCIARALSEQMKLIRVPVYLQETLNKIKKVERKYIAEYGEDPTDEFISKESGVSIEKILTIRKAMLDPLYLSSKANGEEDQEMILESTLEDSSSVPVVDKLIEEMEVSIIQQAVSCLNPEQSRVITYRYGLGGKTPLTATETSQLLGISRQAVTNLEKKAIAQLKQLLKATFPGEDYATFFP